MYAQWVLDIASIPVGSYIQYLLPEGTTVTALATDTGYTSNQVFTPSDYNNTHGWKVIYNNNGQLDIISAESVVDGLIIGTDSDTMDSWGDIIDTEIIYGMKTGYAKAPYMLNKLCEEGYATGEFAISGRSLGGGYGEAENLFDYELNGIKINQDYISYIKVQELLSLGKIGVDNNYYPYTNILDITTYNAEKALVCSESLIHNNGNIWIAYRTLVFYGDEPIFLVHSFSQDGSESYDFDFGQESSGTFVGASVPCGVRPIITLESNLKIIDGEGTLENPYILSR